MIRTQEGKKDMTLNGSVEFTPIRERTTSTLNDIFENMQIPLSKLPFRVPANHSQSCSSVTNPQVPLVVLNSFVSLKLPEEVASMTTKVRNIFEFQIDNLNHRKFGQAIDEVELVRNFMSELLVHPINESLRGTGYEMRIDQSTSYALGNPDAVCHNCTNLSFDSSVKVNRHLFEQFEVILCLVVALMWFIVFVATVDQ